MRRRNVGRILAVWEWNVSRANFPIFAFVNGASVHFLSLPIITRSFPKLVTIENMPQWRLAVGE